MHPLFLPHPSVLTPSTFSSINCTNPRTSTSKRPTSPHRVPICTASAPAPPPSPKWSCMHGCGACCKLGDFDEQVLRDMLKNEHDVVEYLNMIDANGWCTHFDTATRTCTTYATRPRFCRATPEVFHQLYDVPTQQFDAFAISCCQYHIANVYGEASHEAARFELLNGVPFEHSLQYEGSED